MVSSSPVTLNPKQLEKHWYVFRTVGTYAQPLKHQAISTPVLNTYPLYMVSFIQKYHIYYEQH